MRVKAGIECQTKHLDSSALLTPWEIGEQPRLLKHFYNRVVAQKIFTGTDHTADY